MLLAGALVALATIISPASTLGDVKSVHRQEPGANGTEIMNTLKYVRPGNGFAPNFQMFEKIDVNGKNEHPLYTYLKKFCPHVWNSFADPKSLNYRGLEATDVRWNFEKFLINRRGVPVMRYSETTLPLQIKTDIEHLLREPLLNPFP